MSTESPKAQTVRQEGRRQLQRLLSEAAAVCRSHDHTEYLNDIAVIQDGLEHDGRVEARDAQS